ncbi:MAG: Gfo/Idh/MocA family oxidoreductase [Acholeplasmataceae bacterium]|jgi:predicted dehydrogenase|nr:Gfo/Idh/MocA family oxidoreductase [Acholeplasmataceae bacterium]
MFRWAVCGLGKISHRWVRVANSIPNTRVIAAVSSSKERAKKYQKKYAMDYALTYDELATQPTLVDAVYVSTHMNVHQQTVEKFLKAGIPVLCEKSFALNKKQAKSMIETAHDHQVLLMEAMWCRLLPATLYVDQMIKEKKYGEILDITGDFKAGWGHGPKSRVWRYEFGGGSVLDLAVYLVHYAHMLLGKPESIFASGKVVNRVDRYCDFIMSYSNGLQCDLHSSLQFPIIKETFKIYCEKGTIIIPSFYGTKKVIEIPLNDRKLVTRFPRVDGFVYEIKHFMELLKTDKKESQVITHSLTLDVMESLDEINLQIGVVF